MIGQTPSLSFEIFPPNPEVGNEKIIQTLDEMQGLAPHIISVTCSNNNLNVEETTVKLAHHDRNELHIPTIAHLPAAYLTKEKVRSVLLSLDEIGVHQILALRGDIIEGLPP
ncbi:methylenetetrahydrofolate reductase, partial [Streptococcus suis]